MPSLQSLAGSDIEVAAVVTNPDKPSGRGMKLTASPVKQAALELDLEVIQLRARDPEMRQRISDIAPDVAVVVAYGSILPKDLLEVPAKGFVNLHFSLLPLYRGAAPVQRSIMNGDSVSGISVMVLTEGMDEGPVIASREVMIDRDDTTATYGRRLAQIGAPLLTDSVRAFVEGQVEPEAQDDTMATYAAKLTTEDALIDWNSSSARVHDQVRALDPDPGAWTMLSGTRIKVFKVTSLETSELVPGELVPGELAPGEVSTDGGFVVGTGDGAVRLDEIQPATKRRMPGADFARGLRLNGDERMGE